MCVVINLVYTAVRNVYIRYLAKDIVKDTFEKVIHAPVSSFFDVTPLGKILKIFSSEINRFSEGLYHPLIDLPYKVCHIILVVKLMVQVGSFDVLILLAVTFYLIYRVALPFLYFEN